MPPRGGARHGATVRRGRNARRNRVERANDEVSQHGEHSRGREERREEEVQQPGEQNPPNPFMTDFVAALAAHNLLAQTPRANTTTRAMEVAKEFRRMDPPKFDGLNVDPLVANHWLSEIRKLFDLLDITEDNLRVRLVACQLTGEANEWWQSVLAERRDARKAARAARNVDEPDVENITWAEFEVKFEDQYFPNSYKEQLREQFEKLEQGTMTVSEYAMKFQSLSRFAPELVNTEERKCKRFVKGLDSNIRKFVMSSKHERFSDIVELARSLESEEGEQKSARRLESRPPTMTVSAPTGGYANQNRKRMRDSFQSTPSRSTFRAPTSSGFGGNLSRPPNTCYQCGQPGHIRSQCT